METFLPKLEQYCKNLSTVVEYFLIIGVNPSTVRENLENGESMVGLILSQFPSINRNDILIPESLPLFCFPWGVNISKIQENPTTSYLVLTDEKGNKLYCTSLKIWEQFDEIAEETVSTIESKKNFSIIPDNFFIPKCLIIVSRLAFFETFERILTKFYKLCNTKISIPMEFFICHLVLTIPTPPRGYLQVNYKIDDFCCSFSLPPYNKLPLLDINLAYLFNTLSLDNILKVFTCLALEYSVVFISSNDKILSACSFCLLSLLFPFQ